MKIKKDDERNEKLQLETKKYIFVDTTGNISNIFLICGNLQDNLPNLITGWFKKIAAKTKSQENNIIIALNHFRFKVLGVLQKIVYYTERLLRKDGDIAK